MTSEAEIIEHARTALGLLTAWEADTEDSGRFTHGLLAKSVAEGRNPILLFLGLLMVSGRLVNELATATGRTRDEVLQDLGRRIARLEPED